MMFGLGPTELVIVLIVALLVFGPSRLPKVGQMVGDAVGSFRKVKDSTQDVQKKVKKDLEDMVLGPPSSN
jgi:sec-independent protein translocase protein TatA